jgi:hypothetical protein
MRSGRHRREEDRYLEMYPKLQKWINQCALCGARGYEPSIPTEIRPKSLATHNLKHYFPPLAVNENGLCEVCAEVVETQSET